MAQDIDQLAINTIRTLSIDAVEKANSGHPGTPMSMAPVAYELWQNHLRYDPADPIWPNRDRFVLSAGHGSMLLYSLLHLTGALTGEPGCSMSWMMFTFVVSIVAAPGSSAYTDAQGIAGGPIESLQHTC